MTATTPSLPTDPDQIVTWQQDAGVIGLVSLAHASSHFGQLILPLLFPVFIHEFGLNYSELGLLMTVFFVISGLGQAFSGFVVDRIGARPLLFGSMALFGVACLLASFATGYGTLLCVAALAGAANAPFHPVGFTIMNQRVSATRLGYAYSAHGLTGNLGWAIAPVFFVGLGVLLGWRQAYLAAAVLFLVVLLVLIWHRSRVHTTVLVRHSDQPKGHHLAFMRLPVVWWCFAFFFLSTMTLAVVQSFAVSILKEMHGISFEAATVTITAYMLCGALGMFIGGYIAARAASSDRVVAIAMACGAALLALCGTGWLGANATMVFLASTGFAMGIGSPSRDMMIKKATPQGATGRVYGLVYSGLDSGFAVSPLLFGVFMDRGWYAATLVGAALALGLSVLVALGVGQRTAP